MVAMPAWVQPQQLKESENVSIECDPIFHQISGKPQV
jgi:hypothetical protein